MDARDALRRYLEQRRDLGESELVLDSLSVEEAMKLLGAAGSGPSGAPAAPRPRPSPAAETSDWREAIRAAGGAPEAKPSRPVPRASEEKEPMTKPPVSPASAAPPSVERDAVHVPSTQVGADVGSPLPDVPAGIVVGGAARALFEDIGAKLNSLEEIAATVASCRRCPLYASATNPVPGAGHPDADFMIVGEAPGANEDAQGVPFVGQAGQLLTKIIEAINLRRDDVFIANVLKHRPPGNRNPLPEEVTACSPYLVRQIELVRPKVLLALGTFAAQTLLET